MRLFLCCLLIFPLLTLASCSLPGKTDVPDAAPPASQGSVDPGASVPQEKASGPEQNGEGAQSDTGTSPGIPASDDTLHEIEEILNELQSRTAALLSVDGVLPDAVVQSLSDYIFQSADYLNNSYFNDAACFEKLHDDSFISIRIGEGGIGYGPNYAAMQRVFAGRLSAAYEAYLSIQAIYYAQYIMDDMALVLTWDALGQYLIDWCAFKSTHPGFIDIAAEDISHGFLLRLYTGNIPLDNSRVFDEGNNLNQALKESYEHFLGDPLSRNCDAYGQIEALYQVWQENQFMYTPSVITFIESLGPAPLSIS